MNPKKNGHPWTPRDDGMLMAFAKQGLSSRETAKELHRTVGAVKYRGMILKARFHSISQPIGIQRRIQKRRFK